MVLWLIIFQKVKKVTCCSNFVLQKLQMKAAEPKDGGGMACGGCEDSGSFCGWTGNKIVSGPGSVLGGLEG